MNMDAGMLLSSVCKMSTTNTSVAREIRQATSDASDHGAQNILSTSAHIRLTSFLCELRARVAIHALRSCTNVVSIVNHVISLIPCELQAIQSLRHECYQIL